MNGMEMPWYSVCSFVFFFCLEATLGKDIDESDRYPPPLWQFFQMCYSKSYLITLMIEFLLINYEAHWQQRFGGHSAVEDFMDMEQDFSKHHETKIDKGALKIIIREKKATHRFKEHCTRIDDIALLLYASFSFK